MALTHAKSAFVFLLLAPDRRADQDNHSERHQTTLLTFLPPQAPQRQRGFHEGAQFVQALL
jgi:hypothetical protein